MTKVKIKDFPFKRSVVSCALETSMSEAMAILSENNIRHLLVVERVTNRVVGIVTDRDLKKFTSPFAGSTAASARDNSTLKVSVEKIMSRPPVCVDLDMPLLSAVELMLQKHIGCLPVVDKEDRVSGIITVSDLLKYLMGLL